MKSLSVAITLILTFTFSLSAQTKTLTWDSELCQHEGTYDSSKYSESQLTDTLELRQMIGTIPLFADTTAFKYAEISRLSLPKLETEYVEKRAKIKSLNVVNNAFWKKMQKAKLRELEHYYALSKATIKGYRNPAALKEFKRASYCVDFYVPSLIAGGDYLFATWLKVNMDTRAKNSSPARIKAKFNSENASRDRMKYALVEVMTFGWWNCAIKATNRIELEDLEKANKEFNKLFIKIKDECDEPE